MEFVTIHNLSRELNVPARVIRYRLINLIADGKLLENEDFRRDDFKDDQHFVWKINPLSFIRHTGLKPVTTVNELDNQLVTAGDKPENPSLQKIDKPENIAAPIATNAPTPVNQPGNQSLPMDNKPANQTGDSSLAREMIDLLKDQIKVKDGQLKEQGEQLKETHELNVKLTGTMLQQAREIKNLMRLTEGRTEVPEVAATESEPIATV